MLRWKLRVAVARASDTLPGYRNRARRPDLAHEVDGPDVDTQFQRCGRHQHFYFTGFKLIFSGKPQLARETAVMRCNGFRPQSFCEVMRNAFGQPSRIYENKC